MLLFSISMVIFGISLVAIHTNWLSLFLRTWHRDLRGFLRFTTMQSYLFYWAFRKMTVAKVFMTTVEKHPHKVAFYFEEDVWTFKHVDEYSNRIANFFLKEGYKTGDSVSLLLESRPEYVCLWLGLHKIGVTTALINTNLTHDSLVHSIDVAKSGGIIFGSEFTQALKDILPNVENLKKYQFHENISSKQPLLEEAIDLRECLEQSSTSSVEVQIQLGKPDDRLLYIYTSGTTGLPKAAVITNARFMLMSIAVHAMVKVRENDCLYTALPLYHAAGGMAGTGQALLFGTTTTIRKRFSARNFWKDCVRYGCTVAQYIGETCRYLLALDDEFATKHNVRAMVGNGLRAQIWSSFVNKFGIKELYEFYGSTEGNSHLMNIDNTVGAVGFLPAYARFIHPIVLLKCDSITGEPIRNEKGFCTACKANESGVLVGQIRSVGAVNRFTGYADEADTKKKILAGVFKKGDMYFNTGDILIYDDYGYYYFKDRTGDTFRWKGENVSTTEVEAVISDIANFNDAVVYGVELPGTEGKAGMAAIVDPERTLDLEKLTQGLSTNLPPYAQPLFLRLMESLPVTGTFKLVKRDLVQEGYDINQIKDPIYFFDVKSKKFVVLTKELHERIVKGDMRV